jgi:hypothetical protein
MNTATNPQNFYTEYSGEAAMSTDTNPDLYTQYNQEAVVNVPIQPQQYYTQVAGFSAMDNSTYQHPPAATFTNAQPYTQRGYSGFPVTTPSEDPVPTVSTNLNPPHFTPGFSDMATPPYQEAAMHRQFSQIQNLQYDNRVPAMTTSSTPQKAPQNHYSRAAIIAEMQRRGLDPAKCRNRTAVTNTNLHNPQSINPTLVVNTPAPFTSSLPPPQPTKQHQVIDLTDDEPETAAGTESASRDTTIEQPLPNLAAETHASPPPPPPSSELPKGAITPPKKPFKRNYSWLQPQQVVPELPNSKKRKLSAQEGAFRQTYEARAANSTASHFLGLKSAQAEVISPMMDWQAAAEGLLGVSPSSGNETREKGKKNGEGAEGAKMAQNKKEEMREKMKEKKRKWRGGEGADVAPAKQVMEVEQGKEIEDEENDELDMEAAVEAMFDEKKQEERETAQMAEQAVEDADDEWNLEDELLQVLDKEEEAKKQKEGDEKKNDDDGDDDDDDEWNLEEELMKVLDREQAEKRKGDEIEDLFEGEEEEIQFGEFENP